MQATPGDVVHHRPHRGALLPADLLQRIVERDSRPRGPRARRLPPRRRDAQRGHQAAPGTGLLGAWAAFRDRAAPTLPGGRPGDRLTRERWLLPLFEELGYGRLDTGRAVEIDGKSYPVSHRWRARARSTSSASASTSTSAPPASQGPRASARTASSRSS